MFKLDPTDEQIRYAIDLAERTNFKGHTYGDLFEKPYFGFVAQTVVADLLGVPRPMNGYDGGLDFVVYGIKVDLKTIIGEFPRKDSWPHNLTAYQHDKHQVDVYLMASFDRQFGRVCVHGYILKREVKRDEWWLVKGTVRPHENGGSMTLHCDTIEIPASALHKLKDIKEFTDAMQGLFLF